MDLTPKKEAIKVMIQDELTKLSEEDEEGEGDGDKQQQPQAKEIEAWGFAEPHSCSSRC